MMWKTRSSYLMAWPCWLLADLILLDAMAVILILDVF